MKKIITLSITSLILNGCCSNPDIIFIEKTTDKNSIATVTCGEVYSSKKSGNQSDSLMVNVALSSKEWAKSDAGFAYNELMRCVCDADRVLNGNILCNEGAILSGCSTDYINSETMTPCFGKTKCQNFGAPDNLCDGDGIVCLKEITACLEQK